MKKKDKEINLLNEKMSEINAKFERIEKMQKYKNYEIYNEIKTILKNFSFIKPNLFINSIKNSKEIEEKNTAIIKRYMNPLFVYQNIF